MSEQFEKVISDHFETEGIDIGRHKDDQLARDVADNINSLPEWLRAFHLENGAKHPLISPALEKEAVAELASAFKDRPVQDATIDPDISVQADWDKLDNSQFRAAYDGVAHKVRSDYTEISDQARDMAKAAESAKKLSSPNSK